MINRERLEKCLEAMERLGPICQCSITVDYDGSLIFAVNPKDYSTPFDMATRREVLSTIVPLVGKLNKYVSGQDVSFSGSKDRLYVQVNRIAQCKIVGHKVEMVPEMVATGKMIERRTPVSDCQIKQGDVDIAKVELIADDVALAS